MELFIITFIVLSVIFSLMFALWVMYLILKMNYIIVYLDERFYLFNYHMQVSRFEFTFNKRPEMEDYKTFNLTFISFLFFLMYLIDENRFDCSVDESPFKYNLFKYLKKIH